MHLHSVNMSTEWSSMARRARDSVAPLRRSSAGWNACEDVRGVDDEEFKKQSTLAVNDMKLLFPRQYPILYS